MKILLVIESRKVSSGGPPVSSARIVNAVSRQEIEISIEALDEIRSKKQLLNLIDNIKKSSIIHLYGLWSAALFIVGFLAICTQKKLVVSSLGMLERWSLNQGRIKKWVALKTYQGYLLKRSSYVHATSYEEEGAIRKVCKEASIVVIPHGVDIPVTPIMDGKKESVLFLSRIHKKKGIEELIKAWSMIGSEIYELIIAGDGEANYVEKVAADVTACRNNGAKIKLIGDIRGDEKDKIFRSSSLFILPTLSENFGLAIAEAISYGLPVITTKYAPWSWLSEEKAGWIIEPTAYEIEACLREALSLKQQELNQMGMNGYRYLLENYSWETAGSQHANAYKTALICK